MIARLAYLKCMSHAQGMRELVGRRRKARKRERVNLGEKKKEADLVKSLVGRCYCSRDL